MKNQKWLSNGFISTEFHKNVEYLWHDANLRISNFDQTVTFNFEVDNKKDRKNSLQKLAKIAGSIDSLIKSIEDME